MKLDVFLSFNGQAEEAFRFYADLFQTEIKGLARASEMLDPADLLQKNGIRLPGLP